MTRAAAVEPSVSSVLLPEGYARRATLPWPSLILLFPLIIIYEIGTRYLTTAAQHGQEQQIIAFTKMEEFFCLFGATGRHMPALAVVGMLLAWHIARNDSWRVDVRTVAGMVVESAVLGLPLLLLALAVNRYFPLIGMSASAPLLVGQNSLSDRLIMDIGAGVYEEFVFRLVLFTLFSFILKDICRFHDGMVYLLMVAGSAVLFSLYHYWSPTEHFASRVFAFRTLAGIYFGVIFMVRGFGITCGSHCAYDLIVTIC